MGAVATVVATVVGGGGGRRERRGGRRQGWWWSARRVGGVVGGSVGGSVVGGQGRAGSGRRVRRPDWGNGGGGPVAPWSWARRSSSCATVVEADVVVRELDRRLRRGGGRRRQGRLAGADAHRDGRLAPVAAVVAGPHQQRVVARVVGLPVEADLGLDAAGGDGRRNLLVADAQLRRGDPVRRPRAGPAPRAVRARAWHGRPGPGSPRGARRGWAAADPHRPGGGAPGRWRRPRGAARRPARPLSVPTGSRLTSSAQHACSMGQRHRSRTGYDDVSAGRHVGGGVTGGSVGGGSVGGGSVGGGSVGGGSVGGGSVGGGSVTVATSWWSSAASSSAAGRRPGRS